MKRLLPLLLLLLLALVAVGCVDDDAAARLLLEADRLTLGASTRSFSTATRADTTTADTTTDAAARFAYRIYGVLDPAVSWADSTNNILAAPDADGSLCYASASGGTLTGDSDMPRFFRGKSWWFYGISLGLEADPALGEAGNHRVEVSDAHGGVPQYYIRRRSDGTLCDIRYGATPAAMGVNDAVDGVVSLPFRHALSRLEIYISHAAVNALGEAWTDEETLESLRIVDYDGGRLNMADGTFSFLTDEADATLSDHDGSLIRHRMREYSVITNPVSFGTEGVLVARQYLIFPGHHIQIRAKVAGLDADVGTITDAHGDSIVFKANYSYKLYINYMEDGTYVMTTFPQYYEWVDSDQGDLDLGQPTLINGVVWADRNLGATSTTYSTIREWEEMRGYYYQIGRNIPYKTLPVRLADGSLCSGTKETANGYLWVQSRGDVDGDADRVNRSSQYSNASLFVYPYVTGIWEYLQEYYDGSRPFTSFCVEWNLPKVGSSAHNSLTPTDDINYHSNINEFYTEDYTFRSGRLTDDPMQYVTVMNLTAPVTDAKRSAARELYVALPHENYKEMLYRYQRGELEEDSMRFVANKFAFVNSRSTATIDGQKLYEWTHRVTNFWSLNSSVTQPCPEGWRVPTIQEWKGIFPVNPESGDITFNPDGNQVKQNAYVSRSETEWLYTSPDDPTEGNTSWYYCRRLRTTNPLGSNVTMPGAMAIIKNYGSSAAYGLTLSVEVLEEGYDDIEQLPDRSSNALRGRGVLKITRYSIDDAENAYVDATHPPLMEIAEVGANMAQSPVSIRSYRRRSSGVPTAEATLVWREVESLYLPICGVAHYNYLKFIWSGTEAQYASADGGIARIKVCGSTSSRYICIHTPSNNRYAGMTIRPVRDASVIW